MKKNTNEQLKQDEVQNNENIECQQHDEETNDLLTKRIKELEDSLLRSQAELLNYRKRKDEETNRILKYAEEDILKEFLPILDNFERAISMNIKVDDEKIKKFLEGYEMVYNQTKKLLDKYGVKEIECLEQSFNPNFEEAISTKKIDGINSGIVVEVYQKGYTYKDRVLRTAMVAVSE